MIQGTSAARSSSISPADMSPSSVASASCGGEEDDQRRTLLDDAVDRHDVCTGGSSTPAVLVSNASSPGSAGRTVADAASDTLHSQMWPRRVRRGQDSCEAMPIDEALPDGGPNNHTVLDLSKAVQQHRAFHNDHLAYACERKHCVHLALFWQTFFLQFRYCEVLVLAVVSALHFHLRTSKSHCLPVWDAGGLVLHDSCFVPI